MSKPETITIGAGTICTMTEEYAGSLAMRAALSAIGAPSEGGGTDA